jgi:hypothetical protein
MAISSADKERFITNSSTPTKAGTVHVLKTSTGEELGTFDIPPGFQMERWINSWHVGTFRLRGKVVIDKKAGNHFFLPGTPVDFVIEGSDITYRRIIPVNLN